MNNYNKKREIFDCIIIGAGLAGLSVAYGLQKFHTLILEQKYRAGGRILTQTFEDKAYDVGAVLGYDPSYLPFYFFSPKGIEETGQIGLFYEKKLHLGESVEECLKAVFPEQKGELKKVFALKNNKAGLGILSQKTRNVLNAFFQIIHPGEIEEYLPSFQTHAFLRYKPVHYIDGNGGLIQTYLKKIHSKIEYGAEVVALQRVKEKVCVSYKKNGENRQVYTRSVVVATPAPIALSLLPDLNEKCCYFLKSIQYGRFTVVVLGLKEFSASRNFSYLVTPELPMTTIYKMTYPGDTMTILLFYYCDRASKNLWQCSDEHLIDLTKKYAAKVGLNIKQADLLFTNVTRWEHGGTIISPQSYAKWSSDNHYPLPGVYLAGDYLYRYFPYGMESAIRSGIETGEYVKSFLQKNPFRQDAIKFQQMPENINLHPPRENQKLDSCILALNLEKIIKLGEMACCKPIPMICIPPLPEKPIPYGDLVPLGFLLKALKSVPENVHIANIIEQLTMLLNERKQKNLWAFHTDRLITSTDSSLILLGADDLDVIKALEIFYDGQNGYYPQLWSNEPKPYHMHMNRSYRHWCQVDFGTTCFIRALRMKHKLSIKTPLAFLFKGFEKRSGLYFANPYLVDWAFALAIDGDSLSDGIRKKLLLEVLASQNEDYSFGNFDKLLSTALAILTLKTLRYTGNFVRKAQEWLGNEIYTHTIQEKAIPFYSSELLDEEGSTLQKFLQLKALNSEKVRKIGKNYHAINCYEDSNNMISLSLAYLALKIPCQDNKSEIKDHEILPITQVCHQRYQCRNHTEYIACYALPPYISSS